MSAAGAGRATWLRDDAILSVEGLHCHFRTPSGSNHAVRGVTFDVRAGETLGIVGESGSGKTTTGRAVLGLPQGQAGDVTFRGERISSWSARRLRTIRHDMQMVFQDAQSAFNPRRRALDIVAEGLEIRGVPRAEQKAIVAEALDRVGMTVEQVAGRYPHEFSGGQNQRLSIARALALRPSLLVCDEPVASLDVSVQARVLNVLQDIRESGDLAMLFISHDLAVVKVVSDRVAVMHRGRIVEIGAVEEIYRNPAHPYTRRLLRAVPSVERSTPSAPAESEMADWREVDRELIPVGTDHVAALGDVTEVAMP